MRIGPIEFITPPLVEGPKLIFSIPVPESLSNLPFVMKISETGYGFPVTSTVTSTWFIMLVIFLGLRFSSKNFKNIPGKMQTFLESFYLFIEDLADQMLGKWKVKYITYIGTLFIFILFSNTLTFFPIPGFTMNSGVLEITPAFRSPTADLNTTVGLALLTTGTFLFTGIKLNGILGYLKGLLQPMPFMLPINIVGELAKPTNISIRLFGNMFAGMVIIGLIYKAAPILAPGPLHLYFDIFGGIVQSFVFVMLSLVYIQGAIGDTEFTEE
ncbi:MAG: F0F1 ATP synthase subunit A [Fusobacteriaceae bacterium]